MVKLSERATKIKPETFLKGYLGCWIKTINNVN